MSGLMSLIVLRGTDGWMGQEDQDAEWLWERGETKRLSRPASLRKGCSELRLLDLTACPLLTNLSAQMIGLGCDLLRVVMLRGTSIDSLGQLLFFPPACFFFWFVRFFFNSTEMHTSVI